MLETASRHAILATLNGPAKARIPYNPIKTRAMRGEGLLYGI
jgi:hypothetical protein